MSIGLRDSFALPEGTDQANQKRAVKPKDKMKTFSAVLVVSSLLFGCATIQPPPGSEESKTFSQDSDKPYKEAFLIISKQMKACYRVIGLFGNGYEIQDTLDTSEKYGTIDLYPVGLSGAENPSESMFGRTVRVEQDGSGSRITTSGTTPSYVYMNHIAITGWLKGASGCAPQQAQAGAK